MEPSNILKIETLNDKWLDKDLILLHASFQILSDCIEKENLFNCHVNWDHDLEHKKAKIEIQNLYNWWNKRKSISTDLDSNQYEEDNQMLIRLIEYRKYLWT
ncbi:MAG: hypothetical protein Q4G18_11600 [Myroides sp.]|nr:hypothetical protein [uncultured Flavobacterium sp.]MDO5637877.1 hypothetical protein [Myroides sp.]